MESWAKQKIESYNGKHSVGRSKDDGEQMRMKEGFYYYRRKLYYGTYDEDQTAGSGYVRPEDLTPELAEHFSGRDRAVFRFWENHSLLEPEYADLQAILSKMSLFMDLNTEQEVDFSPAEKRLRMKLPREFKLIYTALYDQAEYFSSAERFLTLDELYVEEGKLIFFQKKRTAIAGYDIASGRLSQYYKKEWSIEKGDVSFYQFCVGRMITIALEAKPEVKKGRCKVEFVTALNIAKELEAFCNDKYHLLSGFEVYGIAVMYSEDKLIAWIRSNGFYGDVSLRARWTRGIWKNSGNTWGTSCGTEKGSPMHFHLRPEGDGSSAVSGGNDKLELRFHIFQGI